MRFAAISMIAMAGVVGAATPPPATDAAPRGGALTVIGPSTVELNGFCIRLRDGEEASQIPVNAWTTVTQIDLAAGRLEISENGSGVGAQEGRHYRKVANGWLDVAREDGSVVYYYVNGLPGSTRLTFRSASGDQRLTNVMDRLVFGAPC